MLLEGVELLLIGMGIVFAFLMLLVWVLNLNERLVRAISPRPPAAPAVVGAAAGGVAGDEAEVVAAIGAAIALYRSRRGHDRDSRRSPVRARHLPSGGSPDQEASA